MDCAVYIVYTVKGFVLQKERAWHAFLKTQDNVLGPRCVFVHQLQLSFWTNCPNVFVNICSMLYYQSIKNIRNQIYVNESGACKIVFVGPKRFQQLEKSAPGAQAYFPPSLI